MAADLRKTAELLKENHSEFEVGLDEVPGEETILSVYLGKEEEDDYVDVMEGENGLEFWYEGSKRQDVAAPDEASLISAILEWFKTD